MSIEVSLSFLVFILVILARIYWILAAGSTILALLPISSLRSFRSAVLKSAARGKIWKNISTTSPASKAADSFWKLSVPQCWFSHFYVLSCTCTSLFIFLSYHEGLPPALKMKNNLLILFLFHSSRRLFESFRVFHYPNGSRMHVLGYLFGMSYYAAVPLCLFLTRASRYLPLLAWPSANPLQLNQVDSNQMNIHHFIGLLVFLWGNWHQWKCHSILGILSKRRSETVADEQALYTIPEGDWFEFVSCPHYLAEIVIYIGLLIFSGGEDPVLFLILVWVVSNLCLAAGPTHQWYKDSFNDYPSRRRALIPFVW